MALLSPSLHLPAFHKATHECTCLWMKGVEDKLSGVSNWWGQKLGVEGSPGWRRQGTGGTGCGL